jgi:hypothetical protein
MKMTMLLVLSSVFLCGSANAESNAKPCQADIEKFCPGVSPGGGALAACLRKHESMLSSECKELGQKVKAKMQNFAKACGEDIKTHCNGVKPGGGRIYGCLKQHEAELGETCQEQMKSAKK